ncbi:hypothetical protein [Planococcus faecalis]|uniref:Lipoprotein n=1 Tax=Planococcus faecalis TaxID=1598147 RepID=A0ABN4XMB7_9BACL|nr:hypothetical protein [Planococcus faecalis]AQU80853.1 hypothetical protein AJGP001_16840 [Planococcus faecalis]OHX55834.1 hypothetical protein BB777_01420 [Planococcus faecalis]
MKRFSVSIFLLALIVLTGCTTNNTLEAGTKNDGEEVVISEINGDELVVYKDLQDPTAEYPSFIIQVSDETRVIINGKEKELTDLQINQTAQVLLEEGILNESKEMLAVKIKVIE